MAENTTLAAATRLTHGDYPATLKGRQQRELDVQLVAGDYILLAERAGEYRTALRQIADTTWKPNGVITNEWYWAAVGAACALAREALAALEDK